MQTRHRSGNQVANVWAGIGMCFEPDSAPPVPHLTGAAVGHDELVLEAADGNRFAAFAAAPDHPTAVGVIVLPDVRGLYRFYEELALRFAERGIAAVAIDYFGRSAGVGKRGDDLPYMDHVALTTEAGIQADIAAAAGHLREGGAKSIFTVGFCFGGRLSRLAAAGGHGLAGAVGFYGRPGDREGWIGPASRAAEIAAPILALQAGDDPNIPPEANAAFDAALSAAGVEHEIVTYDGAPHSFFDRKQEEYGNASDDAWARTLAFIERFA
jgi:carboxymethylenebutenolidase